MFIPSGIGRIGNKWCALMYNLGSCLPLGILIYNIFLDGLSSSY